jgi:uncharacterized membrane protein YhaH (DUF805 family)
MSWKGRANRTETWVFTLFALVVSYSAIGLSGGLSVLNSDLSQSLELIPQSLGPMIFALTVILIALIAVTNLQVRRFHDLGYSAWLFCTLILVLPLMIGMAFALYWAWAAGYDLINILMNMASNGPQTFWMNMISNLPLLIGQIMVYGLQGQTTPNRYGDVPDLDQTLEKLPGGTLYDRRVKHRD